jgi:LAO/AO transport system kinase
MLSPDFIRKSVPIEKNNCISGAGINELVEKKEQHVSAALIEKKLQLLTEKSYQLIQKNRMKDIDKLQLQEKLESAIKEKGFNLYAFC